MAWTTTSWCRQCASFNCATASHLSWVIVILFSKYLIVIVPKGPIKEVCELCYLRIRSQVTMSNCVKVIMSSPRSLMERYTFFHLTKCQFLWSWSLLHKKSLWIQTFLSHSSDIGVPINNKLTNFLEQTYWSTLPLITFPCRHFFSRYLITGSHNAFRDLPTRNVGPRGRIPVPML